MGISLDNQDWKLSACCDIVDTEVKVCKPGECDIFKKSSLRISKQVRKIQYVRYM